MRPNFLPLCTPASLLWGPADALHNRSPQDFDFVFDFLKLIHERFGIFDTNLSFWAFLGEFKIVLWNLPKTFDRLSSIYLKIIHESRVVLTAIGDFELFWANIKFFYQIYTIRSNVFLRFSQNHPLDHWSLTKILDFSYK